VFCAVAIYGVAGVFRGLRFPRAFGRGRLAFSRAAAVFAGDEAAASSAAGFIGRPQWGHGVWLMFIFPAGDGRHTVKRPAPG
jgi:hypothetical protein